MLRLAGEEYKWKDDQNLSLMIDYNLLPGLVLQSGLSSINFLDRQSGFNNDIQTNTASFGFRFTPTPKVSASAYIGPKWDARFNQQDYGSHFSVDLSAYHFDWEGYDNSLQASLGQDRFAVRQNKNFNLNYVVQKEFAPGTADSLRIVTMNRRRDNYTSLAGDIESLRENVKAIYNSLSYRVSGDVSLSLLSVLQFKNVELISYSGTTQLRQRKRNDQSVSNDLVLNIDRERFDSRIRLSYWGQTQRYDIEMGKTGLPFSRRTAFITPDNQSGRLTLSTDTGLKLTRADSLSAYVSVSRFQYDTPDTNNFDDRDELRINSRFIAVHVFSPFLKLELQANVNLYHLVYIFGERSADNNWNRIFRLKPSIDFTPGDRFGFKQSFEVLANYVDYDFEDPNVLTKSFVFRKFAMDDSLRWRIGRKTTLLFDYKLQLEENGQLSWEQWVERVLVTRRSHWMRAFWRYTLNKTFILSPGFTFYQRDEWRHRTDPFGVEVREKSASYSSYGPILRMRYSPSEKLQLVVDSVRQAVLAPNLDRYYINNIELRLNWYF